MIKKIILVFALVFTFVSCEDESDSGCDGALLSFKNGTSYSLTLIINGRIEKTIRPGQTHYVDNPPRNVTYSATAGNRSWEKTITLDDCDAKSVTLVE